MRKCRNFIVKKIVSTIFYINKWTLDILKPYILNDTLRQYQQILQLMDISINKELNLRKKLISTEDDSILRDSSVINAQSLS